MRFAGTIGFLPDLAQLAWRPIKVVGLPAGQHDRPAQLAVWADPDALGY